MLFEKASRLKLRFASPVGNLSAEDLWDLPLASTRANVANLNNIAKGISRQLKAAEEEDFVAPARKGDEVLAISLEIVKHVIGVKQVEIEAARATADRKEKKAELLELISSKEKEELKGKTREELLAMVEAL